MMPLIVSLVLAQASFYTQEEAQAIVTAANEAYAREDYARATEGLTKLLERGVGGADVLYNLGTVYLAAGKLGEAVLYLERARRLAPAEDIEANLALARARQLDQVVGATAEEPFVQRLAHGVPSALAGWTLLSSWVLGFVSLAGLWMTRRKVLFGFAMAAAFAVAAASGSVVLAQVYVEQFIHEGVVVAQELRALEQPADSSRVAFEVHAGLKVRLLDDSGSFVRIRLPNGLEGWASRDGVARL